jgi:hypothetical protein
VPIIAAGSFAHERPNNDDERTGLVISTRLWANRTLRTQSALGMPATAFGHRTAISAYAFEVIARRAAAKPFATVTVATSAAPPG